MAPALLLAALLLAPPAQDHQLQQSFWGLVVNDVPKGDAIAVLEGDDVWIPVATLEGAGLIGFAGRRDTMFGSAHVSMKSLAPAISIRLDTSEVIIHLTAAPRFFREDRIVLQRDRPDGLAYSNSTSAFLNYSATWDQLGGATGFAEAGMSLPRNTSIATGISVDSRGRLVRGLSTMTIDRPTKRQRWQFGDTVARSTPLGSASIVGGVSFGRDYSIDPYYFNYPTPLVRGTASAPSNVEIYVNGALVRRLQIGPGPYSLERLPLNAGLGDVRVVVRDPLGRQQIFDNTVYLAAGVLKRGEQDYQFLAGALREDTGGAPSYRRVQGSAFHRVGLTDWITLGYGVEGNANVIAGGPTLSVRLARFGELDVNAWGSRTADRIRGFAAYGTYAFIGRWFNVSAAGQYFDPEYANVSLAPGGLQTPEFYQVSAGVPFARSGSLTYIWEQQVSPAGTFGFTLPDGQFDDNLARSRSHTVRASFRTF